MLPDIIYRLRALLRRRTMEQELEEELAAHLDRAMRRQVAAGVPENEARRRVRLAFGGAEQIKELCRDARGTYRLEELVTDVRHALRLLRRAPAFTLMAAVSLALGIGANTAVFTLLNAVLLRALPVQSPEGLVAVGDASRPTALWEGAPMLDVMSYPLYERLRDRNRVFTGLLASGRTGRIEMRLDDGTTHEVRGRLVSGNYFDVLGVPTQLGRAFLPHEARTPGADPVVVISDAFWTTRFARAATAVGRTIGLNGTAFTILGVAPRGFTGEVVGSPADIWIPLSMQPQINPGRPRLGRAESNWLLGLGRLAPGVPIEAARADLARIARDALIEFGGAGVTAAARAEVERRSIPVEPGARGFSWVRQNVSPLLFTLAAVVGLVLAIACGNVANLLLARAAGRRREMSVRLAMGATRGRLVRQLLTEGLVLAAIGGTGGLLLAGWGSRVLAQLAARGGPNPVPFDVDAGPDATVLIFTAAVSILTALVFALTPALQSTRIDVAPALKDSTPSAGRGAWPLGRILVIGQLALSVPLLALAGLFLQGLNALETLDVGYSRDLVVLSVDVAGTSYDTAPRQTAVSRALMERMAALPGVAAVTVSENGLFSGIDSGTEAVRAEGFPPPSGGASTRFDSVGPGYFGVIGVPLLAGRDFAESDGGAGAPPVAIVNATMATYFFGSADPVGKAITNGGDRYTIVGLVGNNRQRTLKGPAERRFYVPLYRNTDPVTALNFVIRTRTAPSSAVPAIRREVQLFDRQLRVGMLEPVGTLIDQTLSQERAIAKLSTFFGVLALALAAAGLHGVLSYAITRRAAEIALRMALGADRARVIRMVLRDTLLTLTAGFAIGLPAAIAATRVARAALDGMQGGSPATLAVAMLVVLAAALCAGCLPALRASRIDPMSVLRQQ